MACEAQQQKFQKVITDLQETLKSELVEIAADAEAKTKELADKFKNANDMSQGVGAVAGSVVGGVMGGPEGAAVGAAVGKTIGALFTFEVRQERHKFSLDLPEFAVRDQKWSIDLPEVKMKDTDIIFDVPTMVMKTVEGPPVPETVVEMHTECIDLGPLGKSCTDVPQTTIRWKKTYLDVPTWENRQQRIVLGLPEVKMTRQEMTVGVPEVTMKTQEFSFDVPVIVIRFAQDAGKKLAEEAATVAADAAMLTAQKQAAFKERMKQELVGPAHELYDCHRQSILDARQKLEAMFNSQLDTIANSIIAMKSDQVPDNDKNLVNAQQRADEIVQSRNAQLKKFDDALAQLDKTMKEQLEKMTT